MEDYDYMNLSQNSVSIAGTGCICIVFMCYRFTSTSGYGKINPNVDPIKLISRWVNRTSYICAEKIVGFWPLSLVNADPIKYIHDKRLIEICVILFC